MLKCYIFRQFDYVLIVREEFVILNIFFYEIYDFYVQQYFGYDNICHFNNILEMYLVKE